MPPLDLLASPGDRGALRAETSRVYDICDGCRRCFNLCPSFTTLFDRIDAVDSDVARLDGADLERVADECFYCKLCYNHCPYTPPHQYALDFPRLMIAWKRQLVAERGASWRDRLLIRTDLLGRVGSLLAPLLNRLLTWSPVRHAMHAGLGIHRERQILPFAPQPFTAWWRRRRRSPEGALEASGGRKAALFIGCMVNYQAVDIGRATVQVLEKNGVEVTVPEQACCGMPRFDLGDLNGIRAAARHTLRVFRPWLTAGYDIVSPIPSCSLMLKREYPVLLPEPEIALLAERTFDVCEYLMRMKRAGTLSLEFSRRPGRIAYHVPCHLRDQNIGFKSKELLELTGAHVDVIERCSGHDGTWGAKREFFPLSIDVARKAVRQIAEAAPDLVASDCPLAALQLEQAGAAGAASRQALHPIQIVRDAYGLP